jgi:hypothetical protein
MALEDLRLRNIQQLVDEVAIAVPLVEDSVTLALVDQPATRQHVLAVRRLACRAQASAELALSRMLYEEMQTLPIPPRSPNRRTIVVTFIARRGFNVCTAIEATWMLGWRYSNHLTDAFVGDTIVVTEHGWASIETHAGGPHPCLIQAA